MGITGGGSKFLPLYFNISFQFVIHKRIVRLGQESNLHLPVSWISFGIYLILFRINFWLYPQNKHQLSWFYFVLEFEKTRARSIFRRLVNIVFLQLFESIVWHGNLRHVVRFNLPSLNEWVKQISKYFLSAFSIEYILDRSKNIRTKSKSFLKSQ